MKLRFIVVAVCVLAAAGMASRSRRRFPSSSQTRGPQTGQAVGSA